MEHNSLSDEVMNLAPKFIVTNVNQATAFAAAGMFHSHLGATAIAVLRHVQGFEVEEYASVVAPLFGREDCAVHAVRDGC